VSSAAERLKIVACALFYACAIAALVVFGPSEPHVFIYQGF
jgi:hypothetical protein